MTKGEDQVEHVGFIGESSGIPYPAPHAARPFAALLVAAVVLSAAPMAQAILVPGSTVTEEFRRNGTLIGGPTTLTVQDLGAFLQVNGLLEMTLFDLPGNQSAIGLSWLFFDRPEARVGDVYDELLSDFSLASMGDFTQISSGSIVTFTVVNVVQNNPCDCGFSTSIDLSAGTIRVTVGINGLSDPNNGIFGVTYLYDSFNTFVETPGGNTDSIPEPATGLLCMLTAGALLGRRRRAA